jgi:arylamine N-acetyltransferase
MENTNLFYVVLRSLGYNVYSTGGRVSHAVARGNQTPGSELYMGLYVNVDSLSLREDPVSDSDNAGVIWFSLCPSTVKNTM